MKFRVATGRMGGRTEGAHRLSISLRKKRKMRMRYSINDAGDIENRKLLVKDIPIDQVTEEEFAACWSDTLALSRLTKFQGRSTD